MKRITVLSFAILFLISGCATVGSQFYFKNPNEIIIGKTTKIEMMNNYGTPFRVGFDSGKLQWTYGYYKYSLFNDADTKDLTITFDSKGVVTNYIYSSSSAEDKASWEK